MSSEEKHIDIHLLTRYFTGEATSREESSLKDWIEKSPENRKEFEELRKVWNVLGKTVKDHRIDVDEEWRYQQLKISDKKFLRKSFRMIPLLRIAAILVVLFGATFLGIRYFSSVTISTQRAENIETTLPDGSHVTLNADSRIRYRKSFSGESRVLHLRGEAYFEVKKDEDKPFIITLHDAEIMVLGTSFNVRAYKEMGNIEVTVAEGKVSVYDKKQPQKKVIAFAGEMAEYMKVQNAVKKTENTNRNFLSWKTRSLIFENDNLQNIISTINRVYHTNIILRSPDLKECTLTTRFENEDLETVLHVLESTLDITLEEEEGKVYISGPGC